MRFWLRSIRARLTFWYTFLVLATLVIFAGTAYYYTRNTLSDNLDISLSNEVRWVKDFIQPQASKVKPSKRSIDALLRTKPKLRPLPTDSASTDVTADEADEIWNQIFEHALLSPKKTYIQVADHKRIIIYRSYNLDTDSLALPDSLGLNTILLTTTLLNGEAVRAAVMRDRNFTILVGYPQTELQEALENLFSIFLILIPIAVIASIVGGFYLANKSLAPVSDVTAAARRITAENLDQIIPIREADDEIGRLTSTINDMFKRLHESFDQVRQFSADASHELRTPLTILRGEIELALLTTKTPEEYHRVLESSLEEILRMTSIINNLLTLARSDQGAVDVEFSEVDLAELVNEVFGDGEALAEGKRIHIALVKNTPISIVGDKLRLKQLFLNLIDNAIKYTDEGGSVTLSTERRNGEAVFEVHDTGIGIPPSEINHLFDRFYRVDKARSREQGGAGLGLSIAKWIAELHRGSITVRSKANEGSTFTVHLPLN